MEDRRTVRLGDVGDDPLARFLQNVGDDHLGALAGEDARHAGTHAGRAPGDQRDLVLEPHRLSSLQTSACRTLLPSLATILHRFGLTSVRAYIGSALG